MTAIRPVFYVSDGTGITAETVGHSLLTQFTGFSFVTDRLPFVDDGDKAREAAVRIRAAGERHGVRPIVISSCVDTSLGRLLEESGALVLDVFDGRISANGTADLRDPQDSSLKFAVNARGLRWTSDDGKTAIGGDADFGIAGKPELWAAIGKATLQRGKETANLAFDGIGDRAGVRIRKLQATMPQGRLDASGDVAWTPALKWKADATLAGFDPGYFAPDWPGAVNGRIESDGGVRDNGRLRAHVDVRDLGGSLRQRALGGRGTLDIDGDQYRGDVALSLGASRIDARGRLASTIEVDAKLAPLQLNDLLPDGRGSVRGTLSFFRLT